MRDDMIFNPRYASVQKVLPSAWKRIDILDVLKITNGQGESKTPDHVRAINGDTVVVRNWYEMSPEVQDWCREQFGYVPIIYANWNGTLDASTYSTVFESDQHAITFKLSWL